MNWLITHDLQPLAERLPGSNGNARGKMLNGSPSAIQGMLMNPKARTFRLVDDDQEVYYMGLYVGPDDESMFSPLEDFARPNAGCTAIEYWNNASQEWETL